MFHHPTHEEHADPRPTMTAMELSWHETVAGMRARKEADALGCSPDARAALAFGSVAPHPLRPIISLGTLWAVEESERVGPQLVGGSEFADKALLTFTLTDPERALTSFLAGDLADIRLGMLAAATRPASDAIALEQWFAAEMQRLKTLAGGADVTLPGKKIPAGQSPS